MMNLSIDLARRWSPALSQWPKPVMAQRDPTSMAEDQSVDVNRLESQAEAWSLAATVGPVHHLNQQAADQLQDGLRASINHWLHQLSVLEITIRRPAEADQVSHRLQTQITSHWQQAVAVQVAHIPAIELSLTS